MSDLLGKYSFHQQNKLILEERTGTVRTVLKIVPFGKQSRNTLKLLNVVLERSADRLD